MYLAIVHLASPVLRNAAPKERGRLADVWSRLSFVQAEPTVRKGWLAAGEQVSHGNPFFGAEITLEEGKKRIGRYVVSVGATPLKD
jgi:hypothetical protein